ISRAAGRVEHAKGPEAVEKTAVERICLIHQPSALRCLTAAAGAVEVARDLRLPHQSLDFGARRLPLGEPRADDDRLDAQHDLVAVGVMRAQLAALVGVEAALEQRAEDAGSISAQSRAAATRTSAMSSRVSGNALSSSNRPPLNQSTRSNPIRPPARIAANS